LLIRCSVLGSSKTFSNMLQKAPNPTPNSTQRSPSSLRPQPRDPCKLSTLQFCFFPTFRDSETDLHKLLVVESGLKDFRRSLVWTSIDGGLDSSYQPQVLRHHGAITTTAYSFRDRLQDYFVTAMCPRVILTMSPFRHLRPSALPDLSKPSPL
jgi:hypothetical protein